MLRTFASAIAVSAIALAVSCTTPVETVQGPIEVQVPASQPATQPTPVAQVTGPHPGQAIYETRCAACHNNPEGTKAPPRETLARMSPGQITNSLIACSVKCSGARICTLPARTSASSTSARTPP